MTPFNLFDPNTPIAIIGMGVMGAKVAWACDRAGIQTRVFDVCPETLQKSLDLALTWSRGDEQDAVRINLQPCHVLHWPKHPAVLNDFSI